MFDVIPYWMWAVSLLVLALVCGAALSAALCAVLLPCVRPARNVTLRRNAPQKPPPLSAR
jgi:hypothetical protein